MKRDLNLIRDILLQIENAEPSERISVQSFVSDSASPEVVSLHIALLLDCDYIDATELSFIGSS